MNTEFETDRPPDYYCCGICGGPFHEGHDQPQRLKYRVRHACPNESQPVLDTATGKEVE
jgi:hypothetical protein